MPSALRGSRCFTYCVKMFGDEEVEGTIFSRKWFIVDEEVEAEW
jgi:hypothetical protein